MAYVSTLECKNHVRTYNFHDVSHHQCNVSIVRSVGNIKKIEILKIKVTKKIGSSPRLLERYAVLLFQLQ